MDISLWPSNERPWDELLGLAQWAEASGLHSLWYADHFMPNTPDDAPSDGLALECWTVLAAVGALVPREMGRYAALVRAWRADPSRPRAGYLRAAPETPFQ
jgi:hypothetical protein